MKNQHKQTARMMAKKCLSSWENRDILGEADFEHHREKLGEYLVELSYEHGEYWWLDVEGCYAVTQIRTSKDEERLARIRKGLDYADEMMEKGDLSKAKRALNKVETLAEWFDGRWTY